jgi:hypothetical protein
LFHFSRSSAANSDTATVRITIAYSAFRIITGKGSYLMTSNSLVRT